MGRKKKVMNKEEIAEDFCFQCKDGGSLRVCDYKDCLKTYHPLCVGKDDSFLKSEVSFACSWHSCIICKSIPKFLCFCCPNAVCGRCLPEADFSVVGAKKGFCSHCLSLLGLIEGIRDPGSDEGKINFSEPDTYEFLFKPYWEILKEKEGLTSEHVHSAYKLLNQGSNHGCGSLLDDIYEHISDSEDEHQVSDYDDLNDVKEHERPRNKRNKGKLDFTKGNVKCKKRKFIGWGSDALFNFLISIGRDTSQELSQHDVAAIVIGYCQEHKLFHPDKKKKILCDATLQSFLRRKSFNKNRIHKLLTAHFAVNCETSEDDFGYSSGDKDRDALQSCKGQQNSSLDKKIPIKEVVAGVQKSCFASLVAENIKCLYLRRSLVQEMSRELETFDVKVRGSFVRVKSDPYDYLQNNSHMLVQVTGVKKTSRNGLVNSDILLQVSNLPKDIPICNLSDVDFTEEECEDLRRRLKSGLIKRPTFVEFEEKAKILHEVITKHWIVRELAQLQKLINKANEKGWKRELSVYVDKMLLLQTPIEQSRLLNENPVIILDKEVEPTDKILLRKCKQERIIPDSALGGVSKAPKRTSESSSYQNDGADDAEDKRQPRKPVYNELDQSSHTTVAEESMGDGSLLTEGNGSSQQVKQSCAEGPRHEIMSVKPLTCAPDGQPNALLPEKQYQLGNAVSRKQKEPEYGKVKQTATTITVIEITDDDEQQDSSISVSKQTPEDPNCSIWYCVTPRGFKSGPYSMSVLKQWYDSTSIDAKFRVWKAGQSQEEAILLTDALHQIFAAK